MRYFSFVDTDDTPIVRASYLDLARALTQTTNLTIRIASIAYPDVAGKTLWLSTLWTKQDPDIADACLRGELYLHSSAYVNTSFSNIDSLVRTEHFTYPRFFLQIVLLAESVRITQELVVRRPGTTFALEQYHISFTEQVIRLGAQFATEQNVTDAILSILYLQLITEASECCPLFRVVTTKLSLRTQLFNLLQVLPTELKNQFILMTSFLSQLVTLDSTQTLLSQCHKIYNELEPLLEKDVNIQFAQMASTVSHLMNDADMTRTNEAVLHRRTQKIDSENNDDLSTPNESTSRPTDNSKQETLPTWHRKTDVQLNAANVTMDLTEGSHTAESNGNARMGDDAVSHVTIGRGRIHGTGETEQSPEEVAETDKIFNAEQNNSAKRDKSSTQNRVKNVPLRRPTPEEIVRVEAWASELRPLVHRMVQGLAPWFTPQQRRISGPFAKGKSIRRLHHLAYEKKVRLFTKRTNCSNDPDTVIQLLVDCSGSMYEVLPTVQQVSWLLHATLKDLGIPHAVTGHYEDTLMSNTAPLASDVTSFTGVVETGAIPHYIQLIDWDTWMKPASQQYLPQLTAELDNRDGEAIRYVTRTLLRMPQQQKILIVMSDGDPSAEGYLQTGAEDTRRAIIEARHRGITVIHVWVSQGADATTIHKLHELYGEDSIVVEDYTQLLGQFRTLLQRLLFAVAARR